MNEAYENGAAVNNVLLLDFNGPQDTSGVLIETDYDATASTDPSENWV